MYQKDRGGSLSLENNKIDVVEEIASFTGLKPDIVKLVLNTYELVILDKILESQLSNDDSDFIELGFVTVDTTNYPTLVLKESDELKEKISLTVKKGRDFLSESMILQFNKELLARYTEGEVGSIFETDPLVYLEGDIDE